MNCFSLSSLATGPKIRVPLGVLSSLMMTAAFSSKLNIGTVLTAGAIYSTYNNGLYHIALLYNAAWCGVFNGSNDYIADACISSGGATHNTDAKELFGTGVVGHLQSGFLLNHVISPFSRMKSLFRLFNDLDKSPSLILG